MRIATRQSPSDLRARDIMSQGIQYSVGWKYQHGTHDDISWYFMPSGVQNSDETDHEPRNEIDCGEKQHADSKILDSILPSPSCHRGWFFIFSHHRLYPRQKNYNHWKYQCIQGNWCINNTNNIQSCFLIYHKAKTHGVGCIHDEWFWL